MLRLLLLASLLLGIAPTPHPGAHCAPDAAGASPGGGGHAPGHQAGDPGECAHCPPTECATQAACAGALSVLMAAATPRGPRIAVAGPPWRPEPVPWRTRHARPPIRPPVIALA